jgi:lipoprotein LpqH
MENRLIAVAVGVLVVGAVGCAAQPQALGSTTAKVTINGQSTGGPHAVRCSQTGWMWIIETPDEAKGFKAVFDTGDTVKAQSVDFHDFGGFTGSYWNGNIGDAEVSSSGGKFTINGTADGAFTDNPSNPVTATFRIEAAC